MASPACSGIYSFDRPKIYYPGVLPNVALFNAMHKNPSVTKNSIRFFTYVAVATFVWHMVPWIRLSHAVLSPAALLHGTWELEGLHPGFWKYVNAAGSRVDPGGRDC